MILILHISIALASILQTSYTLFSPSKNGLRVSYALLGLTLASGTFLVYITASHILETCVMGLLYTGFIAFGIARARHMLAKDSVSAT